jgi:hypothetical protein
MQGKQLQSRVIQKEKKKPSEQIAVFFMYSFTDTQRREEEATQSLETSKRFKFNP